MLPTVLIVYDSHPTAFIGSRLVNQSVLGPKGLVIVESRPPVKAVHYELTFLPRLLNVNVSGDFFIEANLIYNIIRVNLVHAVQR